MGDKTNPSLIPFAWSAGWNSPQAWNKYQNKVGGRLKGGDVGIRLFETLPKTQMVFGRVDIDNANVATSIFYGRAVVVPVHNLFTSSRMISRSPVVASQIKPAMWMINHDDAERWMVKVGDKLTQPAWGRDYLACGGGGLFGRRLYWLS